MWISYKVFWSYLPLPPKSWHIHPLQSHLPIYITLSFFPTALGSGACPGMLVTYQESQKTDSPSPSSYKMPKASQIEVKVCAYLLHSILGFCRPWACLSRIFVVTSTLSSHLQLSCYIQESFIEAVYHLWLLESFSLPQRFLSLGMEGCDMYIHILSRLSVPWSLCMCWPV